MGKVQSLQVAKTSVEGLKAELAEIDENLIREELHYIDRGNQLFRRKEIYEELYPETKASIGEKLAARRWNASADSALAQKPSFAEDTAAKTGKSPRTIHEDLQIARNVVPEVQEIIKEKELPKVEALKIARLEPEKQK